MAAVFRAQGGDESWSPARREAVVWMQGGQTGEERIDDPELAAAFRTGDPSRFVRLEVVCKVTGAREKTGVIQARGLELGGDIGGFPQEPDFLACADSYGSGLDRDAHGPVELMKAQG